MKQLKPFLVFLVFVVIAAVLLSFLMPTKQKLERTVTINAPAAVVYEQLSKLENFNKWSAWSRSDSSASYSISGTDGTVGAVSAWKGDPGLSGEGKMEITSLDPGKGVAHALYFNKPKKAKAGSRFTLKENNGNTTVTWNFEMHTPRPWNIFNLFYSMDKEMGEDFENGLASLKTLSETATGAPPPEEFTVQAFDFPATSYAMIRQQVKWTDISQFFATHLPILYEECGKLNINAGTASGLYFVWDEKNQQADLATAVPVPAGTKISNNLIRIEDINASKAISVTYKGSYDKAAAAHGSLDKYQGDNNLEHKVPVIEEYIYGPANEKDTSRWVTRIVYLIK